MENKLKIELTKNQAQTLASLLVFASSPRETVNRQLTEIYCEVSNNTLKAWATDRYALVQFTDTLEVPDCEFRLTYNLAKFIKSNVGKRYSGPVELILDESGSVTISLDYGRQALTEAPSQAKYPQLEKLLTEWKADTEAKVFGLTIELLARLDEIVLNGEKVARWSIQQGQNPHNANRSGPLLAKHGEKLTALVQPLYEVPA